MAFKQILFSIGFFELSFFLFFFNLGDKKKICFYSVFFNIQKNSVTPFGSVDTLDASPPIGKIHPLNKISITCEPVVNAILMPFGIFNLVKI
jgi:hypothetical protein